MVEVSEERFDEMVNEALDQVPEEFVRRMRNLVILVEDENPDNPMLLGLYEVWHCLTALSITPDSCPMRSSFTATRCSAGPAARKN